MAIRVYKLTSPARRFMSFPPFAELTKKEPERSLTTDLRYKVIATNPARLPCAITACACRSTASSTSSGRMTTYPPKWQP